MATPGRSAPRYQVNSVSSRFFVERNGSALTAHRAVAAGDCLKNGSLSDAFASKQLSEYRGLEMLPHGARTHLFHTLPYTTSPYNYTYTLLRSAVCEKIFTSTACLPHHPRVRVRAWRSRYICYRSRSTTVVHCCI